MTNVRATGVCLYCGAERRYDIAQCSRCGSSWPDHRIDQLDAAALEAPEAQGHERLLHDPGTGPPRRWWIPATVAGLIVGGFLLVWTLSGSDEPTATTVAAPASPAATAAVSPSTTVRPATPATTAPPASTSLTTAVTTTTTTLPPIEPIGDPIAPETLSLGAFALGPLQIGDPSEAAVGRLVATFGQPDAISNAGPEWGLCEGDPGRVMHFGGLAVVLSGDASDETLTAYRLDQTPGDAVASELATISGVRLGATFGDLDAAYDASITQLIDVDGNPSFVVLRSSDRRTLLWGPMSGPDSDAVITGIYSARPCDLGPRA